MSVEFIDKGVSTKDLDTENGEEKEKQEDNSEEKEKKEGVDFGKLEAVLSALMENKIMSMREYNRHSKRTLFGRFRTKSEGGNSAHSDPNKANYRVNSSSTIASSCRHLCHHSNSRRSIIPCDPTELQKFKTFLDFPQQPSAEGEAARRLTPLQPQQSFESYDIPRLPGHKDKYYSKKEYGRKLDKSRLAVQKCLPKRLATHQWLYSTSRQASTETATTSSGYISPTGGIIHRQCHSGVSETDSQQVDVSLDTTNEVDNETVIEISKVKNGKGGADDEPAVPGSERVCEFPVKDFECSSRNRLCEKGLKCEETCFTTLPPCYSTPYLPSSCRYSIQDDRKSCSVASYRHSHPSGGHYVSCCNSPSYSVRSKFRYDENYLALAINLEDLEFEEEEERRKRRKRKKKRRKERQARARGLMADELKNIKQKAKVIDPEDLPKRARWTIVATACLLLLMSMLLVGVTLRMAPIIDEMVRKENEEMLNSLNRQGSFKDMSTLNVNKTASKPSPGNSSHHLMARAIKQKKYDLTGSRGFISHPGKQGFPNLTGHLKRGFASVIISDMSNVY